MYVAVGLGEGLRVCQEAVSQNPCLATLLKPTVRALTIIANIIIIIWRLFDVYDTMAIVGTWNHTIGTF